MSYYLNNCQRSQEYNIMENRNYELGARIKAAMNAAGYKTAISFSKENDIPYLTFAQHLQGRRTPTEEFLKLYSKKFGVNIQWLSTGEGDPLSHKNAEQKHRLEKNFKTELDKRQLDMDSGIDVHLLVIIFEGVATLRKKYQLNEKKCAVISAKLYSQVFTTTQDKELQKKVVSAFIKTYAASL